MMWGFGGIGMLLWIGLFVVLVWWITQAATSKRAEPTRTAKATLDERLARGEITVEQYRSLRKEVE